MKPTLFHLGSIELPAYLSMIMLGFFVAIWVARRDGEARGLNGIAIIDLGIFLLITGVIGARLLAVLTDGFLTDFINLCREPTLVDPVDTAVRFCSKAKDCGADYLCNLDARDAVVNAAKKSMCYPPKDCLAAFKFWQGGLTFYGGVLLALPCGIWFAKRKGISCLEAADLFAPSLMLGLSFGRIGCFLNGCCYGAPTQSILGVRFPGHYLDRHPTQLYESIFVLLLFFLLRHFLRPKTRSKGELFAWMACLYGGFRIAIELVRDDPRGSLAHLSTSQWISIPLLLIGISFLYYRKKTTK